MLYLSTYQSIYLYIYYLSVYSGKYPEHIRIAYTGTDRLQTFTWEQVCEFTGMYIRYITRTHFNFVYLTF